LIVHPTSVKLLAVDEAPVQLAAKDAAAAEVVRLHFFGGLTLEQVGDCLSVSRATVSSMGLRPGLVSLRLASINGPGPPRTWADRDGHGGRRRLR
jgi:hypothetical protein